MHRAGYLLIAALLLAACAGGGRPGAPDDLGGTWELVDGLPEATTIPPPGATATLVFEGNNLDGRSFCNAYSGPYRIDAGVLAVDGLGGTEMGCDPAVMARRAPTWPRSAPGAS